MFVNVRYLLVGFTAFVVIESALLYTRHNHFAGPLIQNYQVAQIEE